MLNSLALAAAIFWANEPSEAADTQQHVEIAEAFLDAVHTNHRLSFPSASDREAVRDILVSNMQRDSDAAATIALLTEMENNGDIYIRYNYSENGTKQYALDENGQPYMETIYDDIRIFQGGGYSGTPSPRINFYGSPDEPNVADDLSDSLIKNFDRANEILSNRHEHGRTSHPGPNPQDADIRERLLEARGLPSDYTPN